MRRIRLWAMLACAGLFAAGILVGALGMRVFYDSALLSQAERPPEQVHIERVIWGLDQKLHLSAEQKLRIAERMRGRIPLTRSFLKSIEPQAEAIRKTYRDDILLELTPPQQAGFEQLVQDEETRHRRSLTAEP